MKMILLTAVLWLLAAGPVKPSEAQVVAGQAIDPALGISTLQLWPAGAPAIATTDPADLPTLTVFPPQ